MTIAQDVMKVDYMVYDEPEFTPSIFLERGSNNGKVTPSTSLKTGPDFDALYPYGWRQKYYIDADGKSHLDYIPLTLEDFIHPQEDDFRMQGYEHQKGCSYINSVFEMQLIHDPHAFVLYDMRTAWDKPDLKPHTPDVSVIFNVKQKKNWTTFYEAEEGTRPTLIVEVTSKSTRDVDLVDKLKQYEYAGVEYYIIVDKYERRGVLRRRLLGYKLTATGYEKMKPNEKGWLWLEPVKVWLAWGDDGVVCYNQIGELIPNLIEEHQARLEADARAEDEAKRAEDERQARLKADARAEDEAKRADQAEMMAKRNIARAMLDKGLSIDLIAQVTGLSITEVENINN